MTFKTIGLKIYLDTKTDWILQLVNTHNKQKKTYSICKESNKYANQLNLTPKEIYIKDQAIEDVKT